jgi:chromosomal replication initiation ATPase DnaA
MSDPRLQMPLGFAAPAAMGEADFVTTEGNREALAWLQRWPDWPSHGLVLYGPKGSGKTHLAHIWAQLADAEFLTAPTQDKGPRVVLEDAERFMSDNAYEEVMFHLLNQLSGRGGHILITANRAPVLWPIKLPDLRSRLLALPAAHIDPPDDAALLAVMGKLFADRQLRVPAEVIDYLVRRIERSYVAAHAAVVALDAAALATGRPVTLPLAREVLARNAES